MEAADREEASDEGEERPDEKRPDEGPDVNRLV